MRAWTDPRPRRTDRRCATERLTRTSEEGAGDPRRKRRFHPGTVALRQIVRYQRGSEPLLQRGPFRRMLRRILQAQKADARMQNGAAVAIQEAAQAYLIGLFEEANLIAIHSDQRRSPSGADAKRTTVAGRDLRLVRRLHGDVKQKKDVVPPSTTPEAPPAP